MPSSLGARDWAQLLRECRREEDLARAAERQAARQGDFAEAEYWYMLRVLWREKAAALRPGDR